MVAAALSPPGNVRFLREPADVDFSARCAAPGVLVCEGFDTQSDVNWNGTRGTFFNGYQPGSIAGTLDASVKYSGGGAIRFNVPDSRVAEGAGNAGQFRIPLGQEFDAGSVFYIQVKIRMSPQMVHLTAANTGGASGFKQVIVHNWSATCAPTELTFTNNQFDNFVTWYSACGGIPIGTSRSLGWKWKEDEWTTITWKVSIGTYGSPDSHLEAWAYRGSDGLTKIFDNAFVALQTNGPYNQITLTPYMNGRAGNGTPTHPQGYVWYDELIVSTQPIAMPNPDVSSLPIDILETGSMAVANWRVDRVVGNDGMRSAIAQGPAKEVGGFEDPMQLVTASDGTVYFVSGYYDEEDVSVYKVTPDGYLSKFMDFYGQYTGAVENCKGGYLSINPLNNMLYLAGDNCVRRVNEGNVELVAGTCGSSAILPEWRGFTCAQDGVCYWIHDSGIKKIALDGTVTTMSLTRPGASRLWNFAMGRNRISIGEDASTLYIGDYYNTTDGYSILRLYAPTGELTEIVGGLNGPPGSDPYNRKGGDGDGPPLTHVGFNSGASAFYDMYHNALWLGAPDALKYRWMRLGTGDGWSRTVFGICQGACSWDYAKGQGSGVAADQVSAMTQYSATIGFGAKGIYFTNPCGKGVGGIWRAYNVTE